MSKILAVAVREYLDTVKTKAFLFGLLVMPALITGLIFVTTRLTKQSEEKEWGTRKVAVLNGERRFYAALVERATLNNEEDPGHSVAFEPVQAPEDAEAARSRLIERVRTGALFGFLEPAPAASAVAGESYLFNTLQTRERAFTRLLRQMLSDACRRVRLEAHNLSAAEFAALIQPVDLVTQNPVTGQEASKAELFTPMIFMMLVFMGAFGSAGGLLTSLIEEKSNRVVEVLLSALSPMQLMAGKILGLATIGFTLVLVWGGAGYAAASYKGMLHLVRIMNPGYFVLYYVLGFLFISALFAGVGSVCNTLNEAQSLMMPINLVIMVPMMLWFYVVQSPNAILSVTLSLIPPFTPFIMVLRLCSGEAIPFWQVLVSNVLLAAGVVGAMWAAAKVFRIGILMYGKPPSLAEIARWVTYR